MRIPWKKARMKFSTKEMTHFVKDLLCMEDGSVWRSKRFLGKDIEIEFKGNIFVVQKKIAEWLANEQREMNYIRLSKLSTVTLRAIIRKVKEKKKNDKNALGEIWAKSQAPKRPTPRDD